MVACAVQGTRRRSVKPLSERRTRWLRWGLLPGPRYFAKFREDVACWVLLAARLPVADGTVRAVASGSAKSQKAAWCVSLSSHRTLLQMTGNRCAQSQRFIRLPNQGGDQRAVAGVDCCFASMPTPSSTNTDPGGNGNGRI